MLALHVRASVRACQARGAMLGPALVPANGTLLPWGRLPARHMVARLTLTPPPAGLLQFFKGFGSGGASSFRSSGSGYAPMDEDFLGGMFGGGGGARPFGGASFGGGAHPFGGSSFSGES